jgi:hypothetical protein
VLVWLAALLPAAIVTLFRNRWLLFVGGFPTLGVLWFVGALAQDPDGPPNFRLPMIAATAAAVLVLGLFGARPTPVLGIDGGALQSSVGGLDIFSLEPESCNREAGDWICFLYESASSGSTSYRVQVDGLGCWKATRIGPSHENPKRLSGCASLVNYVF